MTTSLSRRNMLCCTAVGAAGALLLAGCKTTSGSGSAPAVTIDVAKIKAYAQAGLNAAATVTSLMALIPGFAPYGATIAAVTTLLNGDLDKFVTAAGTLTSITYDSSSLGTMVTSIADDLSRLLTAVGQLAGTDTATALGLTSAVQNTVATVSSALGTVVNVFKALLGLVISTASGGQSMTEAEALRILGVN